MAVVVTMRHPSHRNSDAMWSPVPCLFRQTLISTAKRCEPVHTGIPAQRQDRRFRDQRQKFELCDLDILFNGDQCGSRSLPCPLGAVAVSGVGQVPVLVAVRDFAVLAESCIVVEPGRVDLGEAQRRPERPGDLSGATGIDGASVIVARARAFDQEVPPPWLGWPQDAALHGAGRPLVAPGGMVPGATSSM